MLARVSKPGWRSRATILGLLLASAIDASGAATPMQAGGSRTDAARQTLAKYLQAEERRDGERTRYWCDPRLAPPQFLNVRQWKIGDKPTAQDPRKVPLWFSFRVDLHVEKDGIPAQVRRLYWVKRMLDGKYRLFASCIEDECLGGPDLSMQTVDPTLRIACSPP